ncbi:hypothetical protein CHS0354_023832 [Potamilus streckersoni]|uniref:ABC transporter n=1 Tax=Potamilus streckersoni TaxID=2493646 RepID=A0AAE0RZB4_9BIVA|nr:hypothetical protein CHS0354_023832 [Potamilus streckersoni]
MRSLLTALGVIIGILAVTLMGSAINGIDSEFERSMQMIGYDVLYVDKFSWTGSNSWWERRNRPDIKVEYSPAINRMIAESPFQSEIILTSSRIATLGEVSYEDQSLSDIFTMGVLSNYMSISTVTIKEGRFFTEIEERSASSVCVIGHETAGILFPNTSPLGKTIKIRGVRAKVIGVVARQGSFLGTFSFDRNILIPQGFFFQLFGKRNFRRVTIMAKIRSEKRTEEAKLELESYVRRVRGLSAEMENDFNINEQQAFRTQLDGIKNGIALAGIFITGLALFVGAIGIMNITFVSVKERTKEIGLRKAIGAQRYAILMQFLIESVFISLIGGVIGLLLAYGMSEASKVIFPGFPIVFSANLIVTGSFASIFTGILSGFVPAWQASKYDPIQALRYT